MRERCVGSAPASRSRAAGSTSKWVDTGSATNVGAMVLGGLGGAVTPVETLPGWAQAVAPFTPAYWAMQGFTDVIIDGAEIRGIGTPLAVLLGFAVAFVAVAAMRFRVEDSKLSWA